MKVTGYRPTLAGSMAPPGQAWILPRFCDFRPGLLIVSLYQVLGGLLRGGWDPGWTPQASCQAGPASPRPVAKHPLFPSGIPTLIVLDPQGEVITRQGRVEVLNDEDCREFPWHPKPVLELSDSNATQLNEGPCLVLFVGMKLTGGGPGGGGTGEASLGRSLSLQLLCH